MSYGNLSFRTNYGLYVKPLTEDELNLVQLNGVEFDTGVILVNLTPHEIVLRGSDGDTVVPPSGVVARVANTPGNLTRPSGLPVPVAEPDTRGRVEGLPEITKNTFLIVSGMVGEWAHRPDILVLGTGPDDGAVRNARGQIEAVTRLKATVVGPICGHVTTHAQAEKLRKLEEEEAEIERKRRTFTIGFLIHGRRSSLY